MITAYKTRVIAVLATYTAESSNSYFSLYRLSIYLLDQWLLYLLEIRHNWDDVSRYSWKIRKEGVTHRPR